MSRRLELACFLSMLSVVLPHPAGAVPLPELQSSASAEVSTNSFLCASDPASGLFCNLNALDAQFPGTGGETTGTGQVDAFAQGASYSRVLSIDPMGNPVLTASVPGTQTTASASAQTDYWVNRARARVSGDRAVTDGEDVIGFGNETRYTGASGAAHALSRWLTHLRFEGSSGSGVATLQFAISGEVERSNAASSASFRFALIDPGTSDHERDDMVVAEEFWETSETGTVALDLLVDLPFDYGRTYLAVGEFSLLAEGGGGTEIACEDIDGPCVVGNGVLSHADYDFFSTAAARRLIVPPGTTAFGPEGTSLPFPVVVPGPAPLPALALALAALGSAPCLRRR